MSAVDDLYEDRIRALPFVDRPRLARRILDDIADAAPLWLDGFSDAWSDEDLRDATRTSLDRAAELEREQVAVREVERRLRVWLEQVLDALPDPDDGKVLQPEFADGLRRSLQQARANETISLQAFRERLAQ